MKKIIYIASILIATSSLTGCEDFLTVESPDKLTSEKFWRDQSDAESGLAAAYSKLEHSIDPWEFSEVKWPVEAYREDIVNLGNDAMNYQNWTELADFTYTNGNSQFNLYWKNIYRGINYANQVLEKAPTIPANKIDATYQKQILNEAYFLRGYYHMKLLLNWEQIVIRDNYIVTVLPSELGKALSTREEAWEFIISDFKQAKALPSTLNSDYLGRATSGAANAYLGFALLTRAYETPAQKETYLQEAIKALDEVKGYSLVKEFRSMFDGTNENSPESIFELQFTLNSASGANYKTQMNMWIAASEIGGWDEIVPSEMLVNTFKKEGKIATTGLYDTRLYESLFFRDPFFNDGTKKVYGYEYDDLFCEHDKDFNKIAGTEYDRPIFRKLLPATSEQLWADRVGYNVPLMRYANVLLMKAEAQNELNHPELAIPLINEVRAVHGDMPAMKGTSQAEVKAQIEHERIIEFPLENFRFYDLRRWGKTQEALKAVGRTFDPAKNNFYPIPLTELNSNDKL